MVLRDQPPIAQKAMVPKLGLILQEGWSSLCRIIDICRNASPLHSNLYLYRANSILLLLPCGLAFFRQSGYRKCLHGSLWAGRRHRSLTDNWVDEECSLFCTGFHRLMYTRQLECESSRLIINVYQFSLSCFNPCYLGHPSNRRLG